MVYTMKIPYVKTMIFVFISLGIWQSSGENPYEVSLSVTLKHARCVSFCIAKVSRFAYVYNGKQAIACSGKVKVISYNIFPEIEYSLHFINITY